MKQQVQQLKINVTNIKSFLIRSNKKLITLDKKKNSLIRRKEKKQERLKLEKKIETPRTSKRGVLSSTVGDTSKKIGSAVGSWWDKLLGFFGWIVLGLGINNIPTITKNATKIFDKIREVWENISTFFSNIFGGIKENNNTLMDTKKGEDSQNDELLKQIDTDLNQVRKGISSLEVPQELKNQLISSDTQSTVKDSSKNIMKSMKGMNNTIQEDATSSVGDSNIESVTVDPVNMSIEIKKKNDNIGEDLGDQSSIGGIFLQQIIHEKKVPIPQNSGSGNMFASLPNFGSVSGSTMELV